MYKLIHVSLVIYRDEYEKKSGSHRSASVTNSYYWFKLASKRKYENVGFPLRQNLILLVTVECRIIPVGELTTCI